MTTPSPQASPQASPALPARQARSEGDLLRTAFRRRAEHAVELITASASPEALALALQAPTDFGALASALGSTVMPGPALDLRWSAVNPGGSGVGYQAFRCSTSNQGVTWGSFDTDHAEQMQLTGSVFVPEPGSIPVRLRVGDRPPRLAGSRCGCELLRQSGARCRGLW